MFEEESDMYPEDDIRVNHEAKRREIWKEVFIAQGSMRTTDGIHNASKLAATAVIDFDEFFRTHGS